MIITNIGADKSRGDDQLTITSVVLSDFDFSNYGKNDVKQVIAIKGDNLQSVMPTVGLLSNGNAIVQTDVDTSFRPRSAFIFANNGRADFLLAIEEHLLGNLNATVSIDALHKVRFDAIANDIVTKDELKSLVTSEFNAIPKDDVPSYASDAYSRATNYADSNLASKANVTDLIPFAKQSDVTSQLASKANVVDFKSYATQSSVDSAFNNKADINDLSSYAINASVQSQLAIKADTSQLSSYVTSVDANSANTSINAQLASKADLYVLSDYAKQNDVTSQIASKVDTSVLSAYVTTQVLTDVSSSIASELDNKASTADLSKYYQTSNAIDSFKSVDNMLTTKARASDLQQLSSDFINNRNAMSASLANYGSLESHVMFLQSKADTDAGNIINNNKLINGLRDDLDNRVKDNRDGSISFNGFNLSFRRVLDPHEDIFNLSPGVYKSLWGYQDSLKNYPSPNGAATVIVYGTDTATNNGMKIVVIDTWGGEYSARWNVTKFDSWQKSVDYSVFESALSNVKTDIANLTPTTSTVGKVDPSTIFRGYIDADEYTLKDIDRPDGIYKVSTWIKQPKCADLPTDFYSGLGYTIQKTTIDDHYGTIHVVGTKNQFTLSWIGWGTNWAGWMQSNVT